MAVLVSVVVPVLNERGMGRFIEAAHAELRRAGYASEVIVVDDGGDESDGKEASAGTRLIAGPRQGKGRAVREGLLAATGEVRFAIDADLEVLLPRLGSFADFIVRDGYDVVIAEREPDWYARGLFRFVLSYGLYLAQRFFVLSSRRFVDTQCGFKAFRASAAVTLATSQQVDGGMYDIEYLYVATRAGMRIKQVPVGVLAESRPSRLRIWKCLRQDPVDLMRIKWRGVTGSYRRKAQST
jgi:dolichyl-phosphate beta-glucosyltransferase